MQRPNVDDDLTLLTKSERLKRLSSTCSTIRRQKRGVLLEVMTRGSFEQGQQVWILDRDRSKVGATVEKVIKETIDREGTLLTVLPA